MVSTYNGESISKVEESSVGEVQSHDSLHVSTSQNGLVSNETQQTSYGNGMFSAFTKRLNFFRFGKMDSPSVRFQRMTKDRDDISRDVPSPSGNNHIRERFTRIFSKKIDLNSLYEMSKVWIRNPVNLALFVWILCVAVSGAILFMVMTGMLNRAIPKKSQRDVWFEVNNQILNALFTLICLYQHPIRIYHFALLLRWRTEDVLKLRKIYCKNGTYKPHEWAHMMVVVLLLNLNCFAQYALCGLNLGYRRSTRPPIGVGICISVAIGAPAFAGVYSMLCPLGKDYENEVDEEAQVLESRPNELRRRLSERRFSFALRNEETRPMWSGGILDFWEDISLAYLSLFCSFCVFGWNMERLGFGNMYVHIATFLLFCMAPFWIFNLAAVNIDNEMIRSILGVTGIFLCVFGLLYGGFWRIQMRKRFNLPTYSFCCGKPAIADCALWLFCCWCSLAQEVRTGNSYDIVEDKFYRKNEPVISPLSREDGRYQFQPSSDSPFRSEPSSSHIANTRSPSRFSLEGKDETMIPPGPLVSSSHIANTNTRSPSRFSLDGKDETMIPPGSSVIRRE